ncbi:type VI secretion system baseplate subunit TssG [Stenotrophomonas maltophilia]|uniref:type VI secretion system baseplate subunit TssG n=1 Tax=Stenotrophomonas maltophilia TaxID=40324 RepID=UPI0039F67365
MANSARKPAHHLAGPLLDNARRHAFYSLVERLHRLHDDDLEHAMDGDPAAERIRFCNDPRLGFPISDVVVGEFGPAEGGYSYRLAVSFLGLHGVDSPLPLHYVERIAAEHANGTGLHAAFLDFFNHRLLTLLHRGWRKYRYHVRFQSGARDRFSGYVLSLIGLHDAHLREYSSLPWSRLLTYAGVVASRSRSPATVGGIVSHCFDLPDVVVKEFLPIYVDVPVEERSQIGASRAILGSSFIAGSRVRTCEHCFAIAIGNLSTERFRDFLPNGRDFPLLGTLIQFLLRDQLAYNLELGLRTEHISPLRLCKESGGNLGWTTFLGSAPSQLADASVKIKVRA